MFSTKIITQLNNYKKTSSEILRILKEINKLWPNADLNSVQIKNRLLKLEKLMGKVESTLLFKEIEDSAGEVKEKIDKIQETILNKFGVELESILAEHHLSLKGQYPRLQASFYTMEMDTIRNKVTIWFGPKEEKLERVDLNAQKVGETLVGLSKKLGCQKKVQEFYDLLEIAYNSLKIKLGKSSEIPLIALLIEMIPLVQDQAFRKSPRKELYKNYSRADFAYDLFQYLHSMTNNRTKRPKLTVATRAQTADKAKYLWIPQDKQGNGATFSTITLNQE
ncbi:MAG: hypothetical protein GF364_00580 [Candidatus Lokiarchaeota archaeon]|nr:hypothetical protein [Candidatus Lokiarchaeota archaeon]